MGYTHYWEYRPDTDGFKEGFLRLQMDTMKIVNSAQEMNGVWNVMRVKYSPEDWTVKELSHDICDEGGTITFNGVAPDLTYRDEWAHETFWMNVDPISQFQGDDSLSIRKRAEYEKENHSWWDFCKTAQKPYDAVVTAVLLRAVDLLPLFGVGSDGDWEDWLNGRLLYRQAFGQEPRNPFSYNLAEVVMGGHVIGFAEPTRPLNGTAAKFLRMTKLPELEQE